MNMGMKITEIVWIESFFSMKMKKKRPKVLQVSEKAVSLHRI